MLELTVPAVRDMSLVIRMTLSGLSCSLGFDLDAVDAVRIASDETCFCLLNQASVPEKIALSCDWDAERLAMKFDAVRFADPCYKGCSDTHDPVLAKSILESLADDVEVLYDLWGVYSVRMVMRFKGGVPAASKNKDAAEAKR
ncbi:MAG: hypothetical protein LBD16_09740 [Oscillospiraceae bacterium]|jgi:hypothetical protein|nr:hypothetical protein [Oscillospiraceae bacterium]